MTGRIVAISSSILLAAALLFPSSMASARLTGACLNDAKAQCPGVQPGGGQIRQCLRMHVRDLSDECKDVLLKAVNVMACAPDVKEFCAGTQPGAAVHPEVVEVMGEIGIDISGAAPKKLTREQAEWAAVIVTMGCGDECPFIPGTRYLDWELEDPKGRPIEEVRRTRDEIRRRGEALAAELDG